MKSTDLNLPVSTSHPTISPDGKRIVFAVTRPDIDGDAYVGQLWQAPADASSPPERLTRGFHDFSPAFSPDGSTIAFLRATSDGAPQLQVVRAAGGEPLQVTDRKLGVSDFSWSPDGSRLVFVSRVPEEGRYGTVEGISSSAEPARTITTTRYLSNGVGYTIDRHAQLFVVDVPDIGAEPFVKSAPYPGANNDATGRPDGEPSGLPTARQLTSAAADHAHPRFTPDGSEITFVASLHEGSDSDLRSGAYSVPAAGGDIATLVGPELDLGVEDILVEPSGSAFVLASETGPTGLEFVGTNAALYVRSAAGAALTRLTDPENVDLSSSRLVGAGNGAVLVAETTRGTVQLLRVTADGVTTRLTEGSLEVTGYAVSGATTAVTYIDESTAGDVAVVESGSFDRVTDFSAAVRATGLREAVETTIEARDGTPIHGWVLTPSGEGPHPVLLVIHGGPYSQYTGSLFDEAQVYADAGYGVVMCNPRGASGYGQAFGRAIQNRMGTIDMTDVLDFLEGAVAANPSFDGERVGIMGGSYGGYLTAWTIAHDHRFAGAIVERGFLDPEFFIGTSDTAPLRGAVHRGRPPGDGRAEPAGLRVAGDDADVRRALGGRPPLSAPQAERLPRAVRAGVDTKMLISRVRTTSCRGRVARGSGCRGSTRSSAGGRNTSRSLLRSGEGDVKRPPGRPTVFRIGRFASLRRASQRQSE